MDGSVADSRSPRYDMNPPYDTVLIIVVENFTTKEGVTLDKRRGSHIDFKNVEKIWRKLGFTVVSHKDLKAADIRKVVLDTANQINENSSSFVCLITTHGDMGKIYGSDSECLDFKEVMDAFKTAQCPNLAGKPKLFFMIANGVRQKENASTVLPDAATLATGSGDAKTPVTGVITDSPVELTNAVIQDGGVDYDHRNDSIFREKLDPDEPHFLIATSLAPETVSYKSESDGTWTASELINIFRTHYQHEDVGSMLLKVNENASKAHAEKGYKQSCQLVFTTTKKVYLSSTAIAQPPRKPDWCYPMKKPYGFAVIINIKEFDPELKIPKREGSGQDVKNLQRLWSEFGFSVEMDENSTTADDIYTYLVKVANEINTDSSCFVCCIMTHGNMGKILGSDGKSLDIKSVTNLFKEDKCPALAGKPKLFFIQACRESNQLRDHSNQLAGIPNAMDLTVVANDADYERGNNSKFLKQANPNEINFLIGYSTVPGYVSYRNVNYGSWYIDALCEIFRAHHEHEDVMSMMTRVNHKVQNLEHGGSGVIQCPAPVVTLTRKIYFD